MAAMTIQDILEGIKNLGAPAESTPGSSIGDYTGNAFNSWSGGQQGRFTGGAIPGAGGGGADSGLGAGLGRNIGTGQLALGGLGAIASLWGGMQANKLANDQFKFTKQTTNTNLNNQIKSYNTSLEDRITSRAAVNGNDQAYVSDYLNKNRLTR